MLLTILLILLLLSFGFGLWGGRPYGYYGWSPLGLVVLVLLVAWLVGWL